MAWVKIDDHFDEHPKMQLIGPLGWGYWLAGLAYCNRNLTDGFIPWTKAKTLCSFEVVEDDGVIWQLSRASNYAGEDIDAEWIIGRLIDAGLWEEVFNGKGRIDGYRIHDYEQFQPLKAQIEEERAKKVAAGQAGGQASAQARAQAKPKQTGKQNATNEQAKSNPVPDPVPVPVDSNESTSPPLVPPTNSASDDAAKPTKKKTRVPDPYPITDYHLKFGKDRGFDEADVRMETERFVNHFTSKGELREQWDASWRNWILQEVKYREAGAKKTTSITSRPSASQQFRAAHGGAARSFDDDRDIIDVTPKAVNA